MMLISIGILRTKNCRKELDGKYPESHFRDIRASVLVSNKFMSSITLLA